MLTSNVHNLFLSKYFKNNFFKLNLSVILCKSIMIKLQTLYMVDQLVDLGTMLHLLTLKNKILILTYSCSFT